MRLLIGVTGGIAAYKALETARLAVRTGHSVRVIQTPTSRRFVGAASFAAITGAPVLESEFDTDPARGSYPGEPMPDRAPISHLALVERAEVFLIAPASANTLAKLAAGMADSLVSTAALAAACPVVVAPAMNHLMWGHPATRANVATLRGRGISVLEPGAGALASHGEYGSGRLPEPAALLAAVEAAARAETARTARTGARTARTSVETARTSVETGATAVGRAPVSDWSGVSVLVSAGGTQEPIDAVRFIGNHSSGRMGYALARQASARGARVTLLSANVRLPAPADVEIVPVRTAADLHAAARARFDTADVLIMAAAVADFRPAHPVAHKIKKTGPERPDALALEPTPDILAELAVRRMPGQLLVGFAAEHGAGAVRRGREKLARKGLDAVVVNDISRTDIGFDSPENEVTIVLADSERSIAKADKDTVAGLILDELVRLRQMTGAGGNGTQVGAAQH